MRVIGFTANALQYYVMDQLSDEDTKRLNNYITEDEIAYFGTDVDMILKYRSLQEQIRKIETEIEYLKYGCSKEKILENIWPYKIPNEES